MVATLRTCPRDALERRRSLLSLGRREPARQGALGLLRLAETQQRFRAEQTCPIREHRGRPRGKRARGEASRRLGFGGEQGDLGDSASHFRVQREPGAFAELPHEGPRRLAPDRFQPSQRRSRPLVLARVQEVSDDFRLAHPPRAIDAVVGEQDLGGAGVLRAQDCGR